MSIAKPQSGDHAPAFQAYLNDVGSFADALDIYEAQEAMLAAMVGWPEAKAGYRYAEGKWSVREVVGHMADTERIMAYRLLRIARGDGTPLAGFDENAYQLKSGFESRPLASVVAELRAVRSATLPLVRSLDAAALDRAGTANNHRTTARALAWITAGHFQHHADILAQRYGM
jgi:hypothetical protein